MSRFILSLQNIHSLYKAHRNRNNQTPYEVAHNDFTRRSLSAVAQKLQEKLFKEGMETMLNGGFFGANTAFLAGAGSFVISSDPSLLPYWVTATLLISAPVLGAMPATFVLKPLKT